ncbi:MAG: YhdT family protein [Deltaproteobacteria bacterium]|jgi:uncharacterized membrane protein YhdT|nr:YhdT family protein [Deltaproteobacteria bacterium]
MADKRYQQADREALITLAMYVFFFVWWTASAFALGSGEPEEYSYVLGLPSWFFFSCILGYPVVTLLLWLVVRRFFKDMPLDTDPTGGETGQGGAVTGGPAPLKEGD